MKDGRKIRRLMVCCAVGFFVSMGLAYQAGIVINTTVSLPLGVYKAIDSPIQRGAYVKFCPPVAAIFDEARERGYIGTGFCPNGYQPMLKRVMAVGSDLIDITSDGVRVNGELVPLSAQMLEDGGGRPMPRYVQHRPLEETELLLMSDVSRVSFDARYFGPLDRSTVKAVIRPLATW